MFGSEILEVLIGIVAIYVLTSALVSGVAEMIARIFALRSGNLMGAIRTFFDDTLQRSNKSEARHLSEHFFRHPMIKALSPQGWLARIIDHWHGILTREAPASNDSSNRLSALFTRFRRPSYIPADVFANVVIDLISTPAKVPPPDDTSTFMQTLATLIYDAQGDHKKFVHDIEKLPDDKKTLVAKSITDVVTSAVSDTVPWETGLSLMYGDNPLKKLLAPLVREAQGDYKTFVDELEKYFDEQMKRVSGWYKRKLQVIVSLLAVGVCLVLNIDTLNIADALLTDATLRDALVRRGEQLVASGAPPATDDIEKIKTEIKQTGLPLGWVCTAEPGEGLINWTITALAQTACIDADQTTDAQKRRLSVPTAATAWARKLFGLAISIFAVSQGSTFWFDILTRLISLRSAGSKPAETISSSK